MVEVKLTLPENVAQALGENTESIRRRILENAAIESYRDGRLSQRQVGEMLELDYWQTERFLTDHHASLNYSGVQLDADRQALSEILKHS